MKLLIRNKILHVDSQRKSGMQNVCAFDTILNEVLSALHFVRVKFIFGPHNALCVR